MGSHTYHHTHTITHILSYTYHHTHKPIPYQYHTYTTKTIHTHIHAYSRIIRNSKQSWGYSEKQTNSHVPSLTWGIGVTATTVTTMILGEYLIWRTGITLCAF